MQRMVEHKLPKKAIGGHFVKSRPSSRAEERAAALGQAPGSNSPAAGRSASDRSSGCVNRNRPPR
jgi:hypothetical protein